MAWALLVVAGLFEIVWALAMKRSDGLTRVGPTVLTFAAMAASVFLLAQSLRTLPVSTAYAVWTGIGAAGAAVFGILVFGERGGAVKIASILLILAGVAGLRLGGGSQPH